MNLSEAAQTIDMLHGAPLSVLSNCLRGFLRAKDENEFIGADFSNIEGRVLAWLSGELWKLEAFRAFDRGELPDIYVQAYARAYGVSLSQVTDAGRQIGKVMELALGFGGGKGAFQKMASQYSVKVSDAQAEDIKKAWRTAHPMTTAFWYQLENAAMSAILHHDQTFKAGEHIAYKVNGSFLWCQLPSKRVLCYPYPKIEPVETPWGAIKDGIVYMSEDALTKKWVKTKTYGGSLAENVTQAAARDLLAEAMLRVDSPQTPIVLHVHDEIVCEVVKDSISKKDFQSEMTKNPIWAKDLPITAKAWTGKRYGKA